MRKLLQANELQELIKSTLAQIQSGSLAIEEGSLDRNEEADHDWLRALRHCPRGLVELVNSKACRGEWGCPQHHDQH